MKIKCLISVVLLFLSGVSAQAFTHSGTTYKTDGSSSDTQAALDAAPQGATVEIADGNHTWNAQVNVKKWVNLRAKTSGAVNLTHGGQSTYLIAINPASGGHSQLAGINFLPGNANNNQNYLQVAGSGPVVLMHDCTFDIPNFQLLHAVDWEASGGVIWNCHFFSNASSGSGPGSGSGVLRHLSQIPWVAASTFGTLDTTGENNLYIEDCAIDNLYNQWFDADDNSRAVIRHCVWTNSQALTHGNTGKSGGRQVELYANQMRYAKVGGQYAALNRWMWFRAGTGRIWGNAVDLIDSGGYWGGPKDSWVFIAESLTRAGQTGCQNASDYPNGWHWPGFGGDGTKQISDPVYIWDNTGGGAEKWGTNDQSGDTQDCYGGGSTADVFKLGRDIFLNAPPAGSYAAYPYPHPLRSGTGGGGGQPTPTPNPTAPPVPTPTPRPSPTPTATPTPRPSATPTPTPDGTTYRQWLDKEAEWIKANPPVPDNP